ncbi:MAG: glycosyltransferase [Candidatus Omnitrophota bacterium]|nr:glycosyltransferase [Candidatus Omnitrophota bacterium]
MEAKSVSIVIAVCNLLGFTRLCVDYIRKNTVVPYELVVVDNGSTDGTREYFEELSKELDVKYLRNETNLGPIIAINQGIKASKYKYICQMHNDVVIFEKGWLHKITSIMESNPNIGIACLAGRQYIRKNCSCDEDTLKHNLLSIGLNKPMEKTAEDIAVIDGLCFVFTKKLVEKIGFLDETYGMMHFYDMDFSLASLKAGYRNTAVNVLAFHVGNGGTTRRSDYYKRLIPNDLKLYNRNSRIFKKKWKNMLPCDVRGQKTEGRCQKTGEL